MKQRLPFIVIAVVLMGLAVILVNSYLKDQQRQMTRALKAQYEKEYGPYKALLEQTQEVVVAKRDIKAGTALTDEDMDTKIIPSSYVQPYAVKAKREAVGMEAAARIVGGEQLMTTKLRKPGTAPTVGSMAGRTPVGRRAVTFRLEDLGILEPFVQAGDFVDLFWTTALPTPGGGGSPVTVTLLQHLQVLHISTAPSVGEDGKPAAAAPRTITLALTPEEGELLLLAKAQGGKDSHIQLSIRPPTDTERLTVLPATGETLLGTIFPNLAEGGKAPAGRRIEVFRGQEKSVVEIPQHP